jgi:uncharacterized protein
LQYRFFGKLEWKVSVLGFGTMRLPTSGDDPNGIDEEASVQMIRYAIDHGVNYIDTAYTYNDGISELVVGKALAGKYQKKAKVATKLPVHLVDDKSDLDNILETQLSRLNSDHVDFYLFHSLNKELWNKIKAFDMLEWAKTNLAKGKIDHLGFSFHDTFEVFKDIVDGFSGWEFCQIQYNYLDQNYQAGKLGLQYAASKGLAVSIMEPLAAGTLAVNPPADIQEIWASCKRKRTPVQWALGWVWNHPEVSVALSGMNSMEQVRENIQAAKYSDEKFTFPELDLVSKAASLYAKCGFIGCTKCRYCSHCPQSVAIPDILALLNKLSAAKRRGMQVQGELKELYQRSIPLAKWASNCVKCGLCEQRCPQHLPVRKLLFEATSSFE